MNAWDQVDKVHQVTEQARDGAHLLLIVCLLLVRTGSLWYLLVLLILLHPLHLSKDHQLSIHLNKGHHLNQLGKNLPPLHKRRPCQDSPPLSPSPALLLSRCFAPPNFLSSFPCLVMSVWRLLMSYLMLSKLFVMLDVDAVDYLVMFRFLGQ